MRSILVDKPDAMPQGVWNGLLSILTSKMDQNYEIFLKEVWISKGNHWKAKFMVNGVEVRYYHSMTRQRWKKS